MLSKLHYFLIDRYLLKSLEPMSPYLWEQLDGQVATHLQSLGILQCWLSLSFLLRLSHNVIQNWKFFFFLSFLDTPTVQLTSQRLICGQSRIFSKIFKTGIIQRFSKPPMERTFLRFQLNFLISLLLDPTVIIVSGICYVK